jgi:hypothetical protein
MILHDLYESRPSPRRERQDRLLIARLHPLGKAVPGDISTRVIWQLTEKDAFSKIDFLDLPLELRSWGMEMQRISELGRKRLNRSLNRLQLVVSPDDPFVRIYKFGSFDPEKEKLIPQSSYRDFNWLYPSIESVRNIADPQVLEQQIGIYEARLVLGILSGITANP